MSKFEMYQIVLMLTGQLVIILLAGWGLISKKFKGQKEDFAGQLSTLEKTLDTKIASLRDIYESDARGLRGQIQDMKSEITLKTEDFHNSKREFVLLRECDARKDHEDKILGMLEAQLAGISEKLDTLIMRKALSSDD